MSKVSKIPYTKLFRVELNPSQVLTWRHKFRILDEVFSATNSTQICHYEPSPYPRLQNKFSCREFSNVLTRFITSSHNHPTDQPATYTWFVDRGHGTESERTWIWMLRTTAHWIFKTASLLFLTVFSIGCRKSLCWKPCSTSPSFTTRITLSPKTLCNSTVTCS